MTWIKLCSVLFLSLNLMFTGCKSQPNEEVYISDFYNIHEEYKDAWGNVGKYDISLPLSMTFPYLIFIVIQRAQRN